MTVVALHGAEVRYGGAAALGPVDLDLRAGEITALVGPSGCGKSTALRLLAGLEAPTRGEVVRCVGPGRTAVVFQSPTLMPWATALENAALPLRLERAPRALERARAALASVGLEGALARKPAQLSGGMAMRVALARALVVDPELLLMDEPFAALDEITRRRLSDDVHARWAAVGRPAAAFVTHGVEEAVYMAHRVVVMGAAPGRIVAELPVEALLPRPPGFRTTSGFREAAEAVSRKLDEAVTATA